MDEIYDYLTDQRIVQQSYSKSIELEEKMLRYCPFHSVDYCEVDTTHHGTECCVPSEFSQIDH